MKLTSAAMNTNQEPQRFPASGAAPCYVAALFVQPDGCYAGLPGVDAWSEHYDARRYTGPLPVVAHPPCQLWGAMANVNYARWGGEHNKPGNDAGCFASALANVRRFGGVLEHPAKTMAWAAHGLPKPKGVGWQRTTCGGWVCEVWQSAYGHRANKATWLYYCGERPPFELRWARPNGTHQIGFHDQRGKAANKPTLGRREANATPLDFRDELLRLAHNSKGETMEVTKEMIGAAHDVMLAKGDFVLSANLLTKIYLAMAAARPQEKVSAGDTATETHNA